MKKIIALLLTFSLLFCFAACKKELPADETLSSTTAAEATEETTSEKAFQTETTAPSTAEATAETERKTETTSIRETKETQTTQITKPETTTEVTTVTEAKNTCTISINCSQLLNNSDRLKSEKAPFVPGDGYILKEVTVEFSEGESVYDVFQRACRENVCADSCGYCSAGGIHYEASYSAGYDNYYIEGIHQLYEKDCGSKSGWMYRVNGVFPNYGCSSYTVENGDKIEFLYTCNLGEDIGNEF